MSTTTLICLTLTHHFYLLQLITRILNQKEGKAGHIQFVNGYNDRNFDNIKANRLPHNREHIVAADTVKLVASVYEVLIELGASKLQRDMVLALLPFRDCVRCARSKCPIAFGKMHCNNTAAFKSDRDAVMTWFEKGFSLRDIELSQA